MSNTHTQVQPSSISSSAGSSESITGGHTTKRMTTIEVDELEPWVLIVISASAAVFLIAFVILLLFCIFRRLVYTSSLQPVIYIEFTHNFFKVFYLTYVFCARICPHSTSLQK